MANIVYLPQDPNAALLSEGAGGFGKGLSEGIQEQREKRRQQERIESLTQYMADLQQYVNKNRGQLTRTDLWRIDPPKAVMQDAEGVEARMGIIEHFSKLIPEGVPEVETVKWYTKKPGTSGKFRDEWVPAEDVSKEIGRPSMEMRTLEEIKAFAKDRPAPDKNGGPTLTEQDKLIRATLRISGLAPTEDNLARARVWHDSEDEVDQTLFSMAGTYNSDTQRWNIDNPELYRKMLEVKRVVKQRTLKQGNDPHTVMLEELKKRGFEAPQQPEPVVEKPDDKQPSGVMDAIRRITGGIFGGGAEEEGKGAAPTQETVSIGDVGGQEIRIPRTIRKATEASKFIQDKYNISQQQADQLILRYYGRK